MDVSCIHCNAKHFAAERISNKGDSFHDCCNHGKVYLEPLPEFPHFLRALYEGNHEKSNHFLNYIRSYNSSFSFAFFNANMINFSERRPGPYCFKIQGQIYYQVNTALYAAENENPTYGQLFIVDSNEAINYRLQQTSNLDLEIIHNFEYMMRKYNIFTQSYQMMGEELENQRRKETESNNLFPELQLIFTLKPGMDRRRYNIQRTNEVATIFSTTADGDIPESYVIIRNKSTKILQKVSTMDPNVEPWVYLLFFPYGTQGWHRNLIKINSNKRIIRGQYIKYRIAIRNEFNVFILDRRLFQQWLVDNYVKIEKDELWETFKLEMSEDYIRKEIEIFIWDEAPMAPRYALEIMDRTLRDIMNNNLPFGGKIVILGGDFRQLLPIKMHASRSEIINLSIKCSPIWKYFKKFPLIQNMRLLPEEIEFAKYLLDMGNGILNDTNNCIQIPENCLASPDDNIVNDIYGELIKKKEFMEMSKCAILSARNIDVDEINKEVVELLDTTNERIYTSIDSIVNDNNDNEINKVLLPEYLNSLSPPSLPPYELRLKPYCIIMLIRNLSINDGLCNGTRLMITELQNHLLKCMILTGDKTGDIVFINRITLYCENRRQFPIKLAFAMTINKSQGQTFEKVGIDLRRDVFNHGQLYVAFSRVRSWQTLKIYLGKQRDNKYVKNYPVSKIIFQQRY
ncbi:ATP-dependent DNA helicase PIF1 [Cyphomyrmex costatus]|uniref:ATP-dependent DNA helicase n=1 Tax=Cyphomyrmex costatus TaxID=456900 RepID=A0A151I8I1_9HYME|nr:ATP-dependent DNA helicase PIF1 [Cyphomyrmex costatus]